MRSRLEVLGQDLRGPGRAGRPSDPPPGPQRSRGWFGEGVRGLVRRGPSGSPTATATAALGEVAAALRAGAPPALAWQRVGVGAVAGTPALDDVVRATGLVRRHACAVVAACRLATELGAPQAALLEQVTLAVVRDAEADDRRRAALAGPRATARLLAALPLAGLGIGAALGADPLAVLLRPGAGTALLLAGGALAVVGHRWIGREVRVAERAGDDDA